MANYSQLLGSLAAEKATGVAKGFAKGAKQAFLSETQGINSIVQFAQAAKEQVSVSNKTLAEQKRNNVISLEMVKEVSVSNKTLAEQKRNNVISLEMVKELRKVNANIARSNVIAIKTARASGIKSAAGIAPVSGGAGGGEGGGDGTSVGLAAGVGAAAGGAVLSIAKRVGLSILGTLLSPLGLAGLFVGGAFALERFGPRAVSREMTNQYNTKPAPVATTSTMGTTAQQQSEGRVANSGGLNLGIPINQAYVVTSRYGMRNGRMHRGIDLAPQGNKSALAIASEDGVVVEAKSSDTYGNFVQIKHSKGEIHTLYAHLGNISVFKGRKVKKGEALGTVGNTGTVDGPTGIHLHFEVRRGGNAIDPESVISFGGISLRSEEEVVKDSDGNQYRAPPDTGTSIQNALASFAGVGAKNAGIQSQGSIYDFAPVGANLGASSGTKVKTRSFVEQALSVTAKNSIIQTQQLRDANKNLKTLNTTTAKAGGIPLTGGTVARRGPPTQDQLRERYYRSQLESARQSFLSVTQRLINTTLLKTFFPRGFGVTRQQSLGMGYVGNLIGNEIGLTNKITSVLSKAFGKQYGQAYGQIFGRLGNVFIDKAANEFSKSIGFNPEDPTKFTFGQILGNFLTKGTKEQRKAGRRMGLEQLVYNYTGIPLGPSSLLSFLSMNPAMAGFRSMMGMTGNAMQYAMNPALALQQMSGAGANYITNPLFAGITGGFNMIPGGGQGSMAMMQVRTIDGQRMYASQAAQANIIANEQAYNIENQTSEQKGFFEGLGDTFMGGLKSLGSFLTGGSSGNLFSGGGTGGTQGGGSGGDFFSNIAGAGANMLAMYGGYKIMQKIGGKNQNPLVTILGTMAISQGLKIGAGMTLDALGYGTLAKSLGLPTALPSFGGATTGGITGAGIGSAGAAETGLTMAGGAADSAAAYTASLGEFGVVPGFGATGAAVGGEAALVAAESGILGSTVGATTGGATGAAVGGEAATAALGGEAATTVGATTATEGIIATAAEMVPVIAAVYAVYRIINYFAFEKGDTRATYSIYIKGNNDINAGGIVHSEKTQESHWKLVENFGKAGFAMIKKLESQGAKPDFDYFTVQISFNPHRNVQMGFNMGGPGAYDRKNTPINVGPLDLRKPVDANVIKVVMDNMARLIAERMSQTNSKSQAELQATLSTITKSESEGNIEGLDRNVYKDTAGNTSAIESIASKATVEMQTQYTGDGSYAEPTGNMSVFNAKTGQTESVSVESNILGYDADGNPITRAAVDALRAKSTLNLPSNWNTMTEQEKIDFYNEKKITEDQLLAAGVSQSDIDYMKAKPNGYIGKTNAVSVAKNSSGLILDQVQTQNMELKDANASTSTSSSSGTNATVVNSGNVVDNSSRTTIVNQKLYDDNVVRFGAFTASEFDTFPVR